MPVTPEESYRSAAPAENAETATPPTPTLTEQRVPLFDFVRRIEVTFPIRSVALKRRLEEQIIPISLADNVKAWILDADGKYHRRAGGGPVVRSQGSFMAIAASSQSVALQSPDDRIPPAGTSRRRAIRKMK